MKVTVSLLGRFRAFCLAQEFKRLSYFGYFITSSQAGTESAKSVVSPFSGFHIR